MNYSLSLNWWSDKVGLNSRRHTSTNCRSRNMCFTSRAPSYTRANVTICMHVCVCQNRSATCLCNLLSAFNLHSAEKGKQREGEKVITTQCVCVCISPTSHYSLCFARLLFFFPALGRERQAEQKGEVYFGLSVSVCVLIFLCVDPFRILRWLREAAFLQSTMWTITSQLTLARDSAAFIMLGMVDKLRLFRPSTVLGCMYLFNSCLKMSAVQKKTHVDTRIIWKHENAYKLLNSSDKHSQKCYGHMNHHNTDNWNTPWTSQH